MGGLSRRLFGTAPSSAEVLGLSSRPLRREIEQAVVDEQDRAVGAGRVHATQLQVMRQLQRMSFEVLEDVVETVEAASARHAYKSAINRFERLGDIWTVAIANKAAEAGGVQP